MLLGTGQGLAQWVKHFEKGRRVGVNTLVNSRPVRHSCNPRPGESETGMPRGSMLAKAADWKL